MVSMCLIGRYSRLTTIVLVLAIGVSSCSKTNTGELSCQSIFLRDKEHSIVIDIIEEGRAGVPRAFFILRVKASEQAATHSISTRFEGSSLTRTINGETLSDTISLSAGAVVIFLTDVEASGKEKKAVMKLDTEKFAGLSLKLRDRDGRERDVPLSEAVSRSYLKENGAEETAIGLFLLFSKMGSSP